MTRTPYPLLAGILVLVLWLAGLAVWQPAGLVDETGHQLAVERIQNGQWERTSYLVMVPGYHALLALLSLPTGASLWTSRLLAFCMSVLALVLVDAAARGRAGGAGLAPLLAALLPFYLPYTALVYTDAGAVLFIAAALFFHMKRRHRLAAVAVLAACFMRQSSVIWGLFFAGWIVLDEWGGPPPVQGHVQARDAPVDGTPAPSVQLLPQVAGHLLVVVMVTLTLFFSGSLLSQSVPENRPRPNLGNLYIMGWAGLILWAPLWLPLLPAGLGTLRRVWRLKPGRVLLAIALAAASVILLVLTYANWHSWNQDPRFLRNFPLLLMASSVSARILGSLALVAGLVAMAGIWRTLPGRRPLALLAFCTLLFLLPHALVEARYAIIPFLLADFVAGVERPRQTRLAVWYAVLSAVVATLFLHGTFVLW